MVEVLFASVTFFFLSLCFFIPAGPMFGRGGECMYTCHSGLNVVGVIGKRLSFSGWVLETELKSSGLAANFFVLHTSRLAGPRFVLKNKYLYWPEKPQQMEGTS